MIQPFKILMLIISFSFFRISSAMQTMITDTFNILAPLFTLILGGFLFSKAFNLSNETLVRVVTDFFMPILVFNSLYSANITSRGIGKIAGATIFVILVLLVISYIYSSIFKIDKRSFIPPIIFMNSGFLGIPLMKLWGGLAPMNMIVIYDQIQTFFIFTLGILIVTGGFSVKGLKEMLLSPLLWAIVLGFATRYSGIRMPQTVTRIMTFAGNPAPALAAFALGGSLSEKRLSIDKHTFSSITIRFILGFLSGYLATVIFGINGTLKTVIIVASALPSAVFSFVLPMRYDINHDHPGSVVLFTTLISILTIPLSFIVASLL